MRLGRWQWRDLGERLHAVVFVERGGERRIISTRKANSREVAFYERQTPAPQPWRGCGVARAIAADADAAPDMSIPTLGIVRRRGRPAKAERKVAVALRLDREIVERFRSTGRGWQTRINAALKQSNVR